MYLGGATFAVGVIALVQSSHRTDGLMIALILIAYTAGFGLLLGRRLLPDTAVDAALALGIVLNTVAIAHLGEATEQYLSFLYVWSALNSAFLLTRRRASAQIVLIAVSFGVYVIAADHNVRGDDLQQWLLTVGTATLAAVLVGGLKSRVERLVDEVPRPRSVIPAPGFSTAPASRSCSTASSSAPSAPRPRSA